MDLGLCEQGIDAGCICGLNNPFPAPGADNVHRQFGQIGPPLLLLREEAPRKEIVNGAEWLKIGGHVHDIITGFLLLFIRRRK